MTGAFSAVAALLLPWDDPRKLFSSKSLNLDPVSTCAHVQQLDQHMRTFCTAPGFCHTGMPKIGAKFRCHIACDVHNRNSYQNLSSTSYTLAGQIDIIRLTVKSLLQPLESVQTAVSGTVVVHKRVHVAETMSPETEGARLDYTSNMM